MSAFCFWLIQQGYQGKARDQIQKSIQKLSFPSQSQK